MFNENERRMYTKLWESAVKAVIARRRQLSIAVRFMTCEWTCVLIYKKKVV